MSYFRCVDAMDSGAKWQDVEKRKKMEKKKRKKKKARIASRKEEKAKKAKEAEQAAKQAQGGPWLAFSVNECLELPLALLHYWPFTTWL